MASYSPYQKSTMLSFCPVGKSTKTTLVATTKLLLLLVNMVPGAQHQPPGSFTSQLIRTGKLKDWPRRELTTKSRLIPGDVEVISRINSFSNSVFMKVKKTYKS